MSEERPRLRELGIAIGPLPTGAHNAITDVPDVLVGHCSIIADDVPVHHPDAGARTTIARTGVTVILPRGRQTIDFNPVAAGIFSFSGFGEMTGWAPIDEFGLLYSPIGLTGTTSVGAVHEALSSDELGLRLPLVAGGSAPDPPDPRSTGATASPVGELTGELTGELIGEPAGGLTGTPAAASSRRERRSP